MPRSFTEIHYWIIINAAEIISHFPLIIGYSFHLKTKNKNINKASKNNLKKISSCMHDSRFIIPRQIFLADLSWSSLWPSFWSRSCIRRARNGSETGGARFSASCFLFAIEKRNNVWEQWIVLHQEIFLPSDRIWNWIQIIVNS